MAYILVSIGPSRDVCTAVYSDLGRMRFARQLPGAAGVNVLRIASHQLLPAGAARSERTRRHWESGPMRYPARTAVCGAAVSDRR